MKISFVKYQGTGNDFVMLDNMLGVYDGLTIPQIQFLCDRKLGVGADGLIKISKHDTFDFEVEYFNADGSQSFCGNGARCSVAFAKEINLIQMDTTFMAIDGVHKATIDATGIVKLEMLDVQELNKEGEDFIVDTGSPHFVRLVQDVQAVDIVALGREIRYSEKYKEEGINVNTLEASKNKAKVATYERGVENETLSCGTGVTACALVHMLLNEGLDRVEVSTKGGELAVEAKKKGKGFSDIWLSGPAKKVFDGSIVL